MGSFNANIIPSTSGLNLGTANQKWDAFIRNITSDRLISSTSSSAAGGILSLASLDTINWRNAANNADILLGKSQGAAGNLPADLMTFSGSGVEAAAFVSSTVNPSVAGTVRLAKSDSIVFRNNINTADVIGMKHNPDDTITIGDAAGVMSTSYVSDSGNPAAAGQIRLANQDLLNWRNAANGADEGLTVDANDRLVDSAAGGLLLSGATPNILMGGTSASFPMVKRNANTIAFRLADDSADASISLAGASLTGALTKLGSQSTAGSGLATLVGVVDLTGQTAAIGTVTLPFLPVGNPLGGMYRISWSAKVTTVAGTSSTLGPLTIVYVDPDGVTVTLTAGALIAAGTVATSSAGNTTGTVLNGIPLIINVRPNTGTMTYAMAYASNAANVMAYNLHIAVEHIA